jgi:hypothetical protein
LNPPPQQCRTRSSKTLMLHTGVVGSVFIRTQAAEAAADDNKCTLSWHVSDAVEGLLKAGSPVPRFERGGGGEA